LTIAANALRVGDHLINIGLKSQAVVMNEAAVV
jgi:hypothetical protein